MAKESQGARKNCIKWKVCQKSFGVQYFFHLEHHSIKFFQKIFYYTEL